MHTKGKAVISQNFHNTLLIKASGGHVELGKIQLKPDMMHVQALWNAADDLGLSTKDIQDGILREMVEFIVRINKHLSNGGTIIPENGVHDAARALLAKLDKEG